MPAAAEPLQSATEAAGGRVHALANLLLSRGPYARAFENLILGLIIFSVASIGVESIPGLPPWVLQTLHVAEIVTVAIFTFEYLLRIVAAPNKLGFIFSYQGLIDLLAIAPFYLTGLDVRWVRALRLLRLLRVLKLQTHILESVVE